MSFETEICMGRNIIRNTMWGGFYGGTFWNSHKGGRAFKKAAGKS
jgi:tricorn protease-like protein